MLIRLISDIHLDHGINKDIINEGEDVLVIAGDLCSFYDRLKGLKFISNYLRTNERAKVFFVLGNHEYYGSNIRQTEAFWNTQSKKSKGGLIVFGCTPKIYNFSGINFVGCTLWTDLDDSKMLRSARRHLNDFRFIEDFKESPVSYVNLYKKSEETLRTIIDSRMTPLIIITHHPPFWKSITSNNKLRRLFHGDLERILKSNVVCWLHGHVHRFVNYKIKTCRVVCNPLYENKQFVKRLFIRFSIATPLE